MPFSAYDSDALRPLSTRPAEAMEIVRKSARNPLDEMQTSNFSRRITANLMKAYDCGVRRREALQLAALRNVWEASR